MNKFISVRGVLSHHRYYTSGIGNGAYSHIQNGAQSALHLFALSSGSSEPTTWVCKLIADVTKALE